MVRTRIGIIFGDVRECAEWKGDDGDDRDGSRGRCGFRVGRGGFGELCGEGGGTRADEV